VSEAASATGTPPRELRSLARGGTLNTLGFAVAGVLGFVLTVVVTRGVGSSGAGVFFSAVAVFTILMQVAKFGADTGVVRFVSAYLARGQVRDVAPAIRIGAVPAAVAGVIAAAVAMIAAEPTARVFARDRPGDVAELLRLLGPYLPFAAVTIVLLAATRAYSMRPFVAIENLAKPALKPAIILALGVGGTLTSGELALGWGLPEAFACVASLLALVILTRREPVPVDAPPQRPLGELASEFWRFAAPRGIAGAFQVSVFWLDVLLLGRYRESGEVGAYAAASRVAMVGTFALQAIRIAIAPTISGLLAREDRDGAQTLYQVATWWLIALSWPMFLILAVFSPFVLSVFGEGFGIGSTALTILAVAMLVNLGTGNVTVVLLMGGKSSWNLLNTAVAVTTNVSLNLLLIPPFGMEGAAVAWAATIGVENVMAVAEVWRFLGMRPFGPGYAPVALAALVCVGGVALVARIVAGPDAVGFVLAVAVAAPLYVAVLWRLRERLHLDVFLAALRRGKGRDG
jgi:O-antigen/teichoic acid export membrane protein